MRKYLLVVAAAFLALAASLISGPVAGAQTSSEGVITLLPMDSVPSGTIIMVDGKKVGMDALKALFNAPLRMVTVGKYSAGDATLTVYTQSYSGKVKVRKSKYSFSGDQLGLSQLRVGIAGDRVSYVVDGKFVEAGQPISNLKMIYGISWMKGADAAKKYGASYPGGIVIEYQSK